MFNSKSNALFAFRLQKLLNNGTKILLHMYIAYLVNFSNIFGIQLKLKVKQNFSTAAILLFHLVFNKNQAA